MGSSLLVVSLSRSVCSKVKSVPKSTSECRVTFCDFFLGESLPLDYVLDAFLDFVLNCLLRFLHNFGAFRSSLRRWRVKKPNAAMNPKKIDLESWLDLEKFSAMMQEWSLRERNRLCGPRENIKNLTDWRREWKKEKQTANAFTQTPGKAFLKGALKGEVHHAETCSEIIQLN